MEISKKRFGSLIGEGMNKGAWGTSIFSIVSTPWANGPFWFPRDYKEMYSSAEIYTEPSQNFQHHILAHEKNSIIPLSA